MIDFFANFSLGALDQQNVYSAGSLSSEDASIAPLASGGYVVVYVIAQTIYFQRFDADGAKIGNPAVLSPGGASSFSSQPSVAGLANGGFVVSWVDSTTHVAWQMFDSDGVATSAVFSAGIPSNYQQQPTVVELANGDIAVSWTFNSTASSIRTQIFHPNGQPVTGEIVATASSFLNAYYPQALALSGGGFLLSWVEGPTVHARTYDATGQAQGNDVQVANIVSYHNNFFQSLAALPGGGYVITWTEDGDTGGVKSKIMGQRYAADGTEVGSRFQVNTDLTYDAAQSSVTTLDGGGFIVTWRSAVPGVGPNYFQAGDIYAQVFDASGQKVGGEFLVNTVTSLGQDLPVVTAFGTGDIAIVWRSFNSSGGSSIVSRNLYSTTNGSESSEGIVGANGVDFIRALGGSDVVNGFGGNDVILGGSGDDTIDGGDGDDTIVSDDGRDTLFGGAGNDAFVLGAFLTGVDRIDGGLGSNDQVAIEGIYTGANSLVLEASTLVGVEVLAALPGGSYDITLNDGNTAAGGTLTVFGGNLGAGESFRVNASAETNGTIITYGGLGTDTITGGGGNDGFYFGPSKYGASDTVSGGAGTNDQLALDGNYTLTITSREDVEVLALLRGPTGTPNTFNITVADSFTPTGQTRIIWGAQLLTNLVIDASAETNGNLIFFGGTRSDTLTGGAGGDAISGGGGGDALRGGLGNDLFRYSDLSDSNGTTNATRDRILDFVSGDKIDLSGIDAITGGSNDAFSFIGGGAFTNVAGQLRSVDNGDGTYTIEGDVNGDGIADLAILVTAPAPIGAGDFYL